MDAASQVFDVIENIIPDFDQWNFRFENSDSAQISSWLKDDANKEDPKVFTTWVKEEGMCSPNIVSDEPNVPYEQPIVSSSDFDVFNEFFPSVSPQSPSSVSSYSPNSFERASPPAGYPQNAAPQWLNNQFAYQSTYEPQVFYNPQTESFPYQNSGQKSGKSLEKCSNCGIQQSTMWRWNPNTRERECNACNLYEAKTNCKRPEKLWKNTILKRRRTNRNGLQIPKQDNSVLSHFGSHHFST